MCYVTHMNKEISHVSHQQVTESCIMSRSSTSQQGIYYVSHMNKAMSHAIWYQQDKRDMYHVTCITKTCIMISTRQQDTCHVRCIAKTIKRRAMQWVMSHVTCINKSTSRQDNHTACHVTRTVMSHINTSTGQHAHSFSLTHTQTHARALSLSFTLPLHSISLSLSLSLLFCISRSLFLTHWWRRPIACFLIGPFPQKSPVISGSFAERDLQVHMIRHPMHLCGPLFTKEIIWISQFLVRMYTCTTSQQLASNLHYTTAPCVNTYMYHTRAPRDAK